MKLVWWMVAGSVMSSLAMTVVLGAPTRSSIWLGMAGPLIAMVWTWISVEGMFKRRPDGVTSLMIKAFAAKMIFFAAYITLILSADLVRPVPFVVSFTFHYLALHLMMAFSLRRLTAGPRPSAGALQT